MAEDPSLGAIRFRAMGGLDLDTVVKIETESYEFPWLRKTFEDCLTASYECWIGELLGREERDEIIGHGILNVSADEAPFVEYMREEAISGTWFWTRYRWLFD